MPDSVTINYELDTASAPPNECKATASYKSQEVAAYGGSWAEAKTNAVNRCKQIKAVGDPPASEDIDLDAL